MLLYYTLIHSSLNTLLTHPYCTPTVHPLYTHTTPSHQLCPSVSREKSSGYFEVSLTVDGQDMFSRLRDQHLVDYKQPLISEGDLCPPPATNPTSQDAPPNQRAQYPPVATNSTTSDTTTTTKLAKVDHHYDHQAFVTAEGHVDEGYMQQSGAQRQVVGEVTGDSVKEFIDNAKRRMRRNDDDDYTPKEERYGYHRNRRVVGENRENRFKRISELESLARIEIAERRMVQQEKVNSTEQASESSATVVVDNDCVVLTNVDDDTQGKLGDVDIRKENEGIQGQEQEQGVIDESGDNVKLKSTCDEGSEMKQTSDKPKRSDGLVYVEG